MEQQSAPDPGLEPEGPGLPAEGSREPWFRLPFRRRYQSPSALLQLAGLLALIALSHPTPLGFGAGLSLVAAGELLRVWATGHLVKTDRLTMTGPYAHLRHPLYAGTLLIGTGFALILGGWLSAVVLPGFLLYFFFSYFPYKERVESSRLERIYGRDYAAYRAAVPALLPRRTAWFPPHRSHNAGSASRWSVEAFRENHELGTAVGLAIALAALAWRLLLAT